MSKPEFVHLHNHSEYSLMDGVIRLSDKDGKPSQALKDLAIVQLVGILIGTYSSIFFATPLLVSMRERTELVRVHTRRVQNRRRGASERATAAADAVEVTESATVSASRCTSHSRNRR